ncbi:MAG: hypothetical protein ACXWVS_12390 [Hyphomicrobium sp.]
MSDVDAPASQRPRLLLVADDPSMLHSLKFSLELEGFDVDAFTLAQLLAIEDRLPSYGCVVFDYMPPEIGAPSLLDLLGRHNEFWPAVVIATLPGLEVSDQLGVTGAVVIEKPLLADDLTDAIRKLIKGRRHASSNPARKRPMRAYSNALDPH